MCFLLEIVLFRTLIENYYPSGDDIALIVNSTSYTRTLDPTLWLTSGFSQYFRVHPETPASGSDFIRPGVNVVFWANYSIFGDSWGSYLYANYLIHAVACGMAFWLARGFLKVPWTLSLAAPVIMFLTPTVGGLLNSSSWISDPMGAILAGAALLLVLHERWVFGTLLLLAAVFTKEINVFAPLAAAIMFLLMHHRRQSRHQRRGYLPATVLLCVPLSVWLLVRFMLFHGFHNTYALDELTSPLTMALREILALCVWPTGLLAEVDVPGSLQSLLKGESFSALGAILGLLVNAAAIIGLLTAVLCLRKPLVQQKYSQEILLQPWFFGILGIVIVLGLGGLRFGYGLPIVGIPLALAMITKVQRLPVRLFVAMILIAVTVQGAIQFPINAGYRDCELSRNLFSTLQANGDKYDRLYLFNDFAARSSGRWLQEFAKIRSEVIVVNGITGFDSSDRNHSTVTTNAQRNGNACCVTVRLAKPTAFTLQNVPLNTLSKNRRTIAVGNTRKYEFPEFAQSLNRTGTLVRFDLGSVMKVRIADSNHYGLLDFDTASQSYRVRAF
jgi:hypothetical protein